MNEYSVDFRGVVDLYMILNGKLPAEDLVENWRNQTARLELISNHEETDPDELVLDLRRLLQEDGFSPQRGILICDDPQSVELSRKLGLALVIGISSPGVSKRELYEKGASLVMDRFRQINFTEGERETTSFVQHLPSVFSDLHKYHNVFDPKNTVFFFDYDGTLSPIVNDPAKAVIGEQTRDLLHQLAKESPVAIVSGRDMDDIREFIQLDNLIYAGSHGFRISGPDGLYMEHPRGSELLPMLDEMEQKLRAGLGSEFPGVEVERKHYAIAVHYRNASGEAGREVRNLARKLARENPHFKTGSGKKIIEIKPSLDWHKGKAIEWIMQELGYSLTGKMKAMYTGDDITDEDAFKALADHGTGILVGSHSQPSAAKYHLKDVGEVTKFLHYLVHSN